MRTKFYVIGVLSIGLFFSGCGSKAGSVLPANEKLCQIVKYKNDYCQNNQDVYVVEGLGDANIITHMNLNNSTRAVLQIAAKTTLDKGKKYFAIIEPSLLSNSGASMINTAQEYLKKCEIGLDGSFFNGDPCSLHIRSPRIGIMMIKIFEEQPSEILTFNAKEVMDYLKESDKLQEAGYRTIGSKEILSGT